MQCLNSVAGGEVCTQCQAMIQGCQDQYPPNFFVIKSKKRYTWGYFILIWIHIYPTTFLKVPWKMSDVAKGWNSKKKLALDPKWRALAQIWGQMSDSSHQGRTVLFSDFFKSWNICLNRQKEMASGAMFSPFFLYQGSVFFVKKVKLCIIHHLCSWSKVYIV